MDGKDVAFLHDCVTASSLHRRPITSTWQTILLHYSSLRMLKCDVGMASLSMRFRVDADFFQDAARVDVDFFLDG